MPNEIHVVIAGSSTGGCNYIIRIMKAIKEFGFCNVLVEAGAKQEEVYVAVREQLELTEEVTSSKLFANVFKEE